MRISQRVAVLNCCSQPFRDDDDGARRRPRRVALAAQSQKVEPLDRLLADDRDGRAGVQAERLPLAVCAQCDEGRKCIRLAQPSLLSADQQLRCQSTRPELGEREPRLIPGRSSQPDEFEHSTEITQEILALGHPTEELDPFRWMEVAVYEAADEISLCRSTVVVTQMVEGERLLQPDLRAESNTEGEEQCRVRLKG